MLKNIDPVLSPELVCAMMEMGHGDEIIIADANFPGNALAKRLIRADGISVPRMLEAMLKYLPLDYYAKEQIALMETVAGDSKPPIWDTYQDILSRFEPNANIAYVERFAYYERAKAAYAVVLTGEFSPYANVLLKKGCVKHPLTP